MREKLIELLSNYFDIGDSYAYNLTRTKTAFMCGTMGFDDFEEFDDETVSDIADHLIANGVTIPVRCKDCKKRYNPKECPMCVFVYGEQHDVTHDDGYCDRGERRSDAETD